MSRFVYGVNPVLGGASRRTPRTSSRVLVERGTKDGHPAARTGWGQAAADAGVRVEDVPQGDLAHRSCSGSSPGTSREPDPIPLCGVEDVLSALDGKGLAAGAGRSHRIRRTWAPSRAQRPRARRSGHRGSQGTAPPGSRLPRSRRPPARWSTVRWPASPISLGALDLMKQQGLWTVALAADADKELGQVI